jgi:hypothetical protein
MARFGSFVFGISTFGSEGGTVAAGVHNGPALTPVGFGDVGFTRIFREQGRGSLPDWAVHPRLARFPVPGGGVIVQNAGYDPDTLELRIEVKDVADAAALRLLVGTENTLVLRDGIWSDDGVFHWTFDSGYRHFTNVLLADLAPEGIQLWGGVWFTASFERVHPT